LIERDRVQPRVDFLLTTQSLITSDESVAWPLISPANPFDSSNPSGRTSKTLAHTSPAQAQCLADIAYGRSGDKGTSANVGVLIRSAENYDWLCGWLTAQRVADYFQPLGSISVERFELPNLGGLNFVINDILKRGLRNDAQGKALAQALLAMRLH
jgi:hypothetical protein